MRNFQEQVKKAWTWISCSGDLKQFANSRPSASNFKSFSRSLEQFFLTVGQNNFDNKIPFLPTTFFLYELLFFHRYPSGYECSQANPGIIQLRNAPWPPEESRRWLSYSICIGEVVWSFMFAVELAGSYLGHVPCKFWKVGLGLSIFHRSVMGEIDLLWM